MKEPVACEADTKGTPEHYIAHQHQMKNEIASLEKKLKQKFEEIDHTVSSQEDFEKRIGDKLGEMEQEL